MKRVITVLVISMFMLSVIAVGTAEAFTQITAQEAYDAYDSQVDPITEGSAHVLFIDCRTLPEYYFVGNPADADGNPIAYNIPWKYWAGKINKANEPLYRIHKGLFKYCLRQLIKKSYIKEYGKGIKFPTAEKPLSIIIMCRSGDRSGDSAAYIEGLAGKKGWKWLEHTSIYEIDNWLKNGRGGFQGSGMNSKECHGGDLAGYRGYPERLEPNPLLPTSSPCDSYCYYEVDSDNLESDECWNGEKDVPIDENVSVSWMDTGLPITQKTNQCMIWKYMFRKACWVD